MKKQYGFSAVVLVLILVAVGIIGFAGFRVYQMQNEPANTETSTAADQPIENAEDLKAAEDTLNEADLDALDTSELDQIEKELL